ncbi:MAG TPA: mechanosensitive ion channel domain-containing protein [Thermodesulfovibrionales bacterium]|jgi:MscS family membrane protein|nr:mechanosensitive ion channel domain-containing protein [Thermodesulfovibrionales bacterium]
MKRLIETLKISASPYINAILFVLILIVFAKFIDILVDKVFRRFARFTKSDVDDLIIDAIHRPIYLTIILVGCTVVIAYLQPSPEIIWYVNNSLYSIIAVLWTITMIKTGNIIIEKVLSKASDVTGLRKDIIPLIENVFKIGLIGGTLMIVLSIWKINVTPLLASAGIVGVAIAIAAKDTLSNFFGGISIFIDRPYKIGDYIVIEGGERGEVASIGVRSTRIKTRDDVLITIPNAIIANSKIINESAPIPNFRVRVAISVAYGSDIDLVEKTLLEIASVNDNILPEPDPRVRFREFGDSALNFELLCWAREPSLRGRIVHELNRAIYKNFGELGITIPFPQRDLHIYQK